MRRITLMFILYSLGVTLCFAQSRDDDFSKLLPQLGMQSHQIGYFEQEKQIAGLSQSLKSSGSYYINQQQGIVWHQSEPFEDLTVVKQGQLFSLVDNQLVNQNVPTSAVSLITEIFTGLLKNDVSRLKQQFKIEFFSSLDGEWRVELIPSVSPLNAIFELIVVYGSHQQLTKVELIESSGDSSLLTLTANNSISVDSLKQWLD